MAPELGEALDPERFERVRHSVVLPAASLRAGRWELAQLLGAEGVRAPVIGILLVKGCMTMEMSVAGRPCTRLITAGELVLIDGRSGPGLACSWVWTALGEVVVAILDQRVLVIARHLPRLLSALLQRASEQTRQSFLQQAISQLPRVDDRLLALFWVIADRIGTISGDEIRLELSVTHEMLAHMIGARRPTVSLGLTRLHGQNLLHNDGGHWLLNRASVARVRPLVQSVPAGVSAPAAGARR